MARAAVSWAVALPMLLHCMGAVLAAGGNDGQEGERLIGWRGETYGQNQGDAAEAPNATKSSDSSPWIETISWSPRAFIYHGFLSKAECEHLMATAKKRLERSLVVSDKGDVPDPIRTSYSASMEIREDDVVTAVEDRIADWTHLPVCHQEPMEVLRYQNGQKYDSHWDWFDSHETTPELGNRMATVLMYLSDVSPSSGGETALPLAVPLDEDAQSVKGKGYSDCANRQGLSVVPHQGDVLLFWDMDPSGKTTDRHALHASCPTFKGEKWTATKWIHNKCIS